MTNETDFPFSVCFDDLKYPELEDLQFFMTIALNGDPELIVINETETPVKDWGGVLVAYMEYIARNYNGKINPEDIPFLEPAPPGNNKHEYRSVTFGGRQYYYRAKGIGSEYLEIIFKLWDMLLERLGIDDFVEICFTNVDESLLTPHMLPEFDAFPEPDDEEPDIIQYLEDKLRESAQEKAFERNFERIQRRIEENEKKIAENEKKIAEEKKQP
ncbi:MAG: hypothetical protein IJT95_01160 [Abditibacteriota bacterium]|nr:hypothetical protein [Abditibacteriota bacterium]